LAPKTTNLGAHHIAHLGNLQKFTKKYHFIWKPAKNVSFSYKKQTFFSKKTTKKLTKKWKKQTKTIKKVQKKRWKMGKMTKKAMKNEKNDEKNILLRTQNRRVLQLWRPAKTSHFRAVFGAKKWHF
jgi:hypothetical protein